MLAEALAESRRLLAGLEASGARPPQKARRGGRTRTGSREQQLLDEAFAETQRLLGFVDAA